MNHPFSIRIFVPDGDPDGLRIIERSNWKGVGVVFTRADFVNQRQRPEFRCTGVYILIGAGDEGELPLVYVGEGEPVLPRLNAHFANKEFWTWGLFFATSDDSLNKAHVRYLEARLIALAKAAKRCRLDNSQFPEPAQLAEWEMADLESFLADVLSIVPILGLTAFQSPAKKRPRKDDLVATSKGITARGYVSSGGFTVRAQSQMMGREVRSIHQYLAILRRQLIEQGVVTADGDGYRFVQDYVFNSPSTAAGTVFGRSANGRVEWKTPAGKTLKAIQEEQLGGGD